MDEDQDHRVRGAIQQAKLLAGFRPGYALHRKRCDLLTHLWAGEDGLLLGSGPGSHRRGQGKIAPGLKTHGTSLPVGRRPLGRGVQKRRICPVGEEPGLGPANRPRYGFRSTRPVSLLELQNIHKSFAGVPALRGVSLDVRAGETHALVGANGAGKSTLIKVLAGVEWADAGEILLGNRLVRFRSPGEALQAGIRVIHQEFHLAPELSVAENLLLGQEPIRRWAGFLPILDRKALREQARKLLDELGFTLDATQPVKE
ncbi:MAG: sugar ABC transporter ATP-binding protein, partial [Armatimonadetes bacterium]|nr:sugar ABC transporter ATP-binding protein [Armatimonadota bacterium]